jgi:hypothetical protein
MKNLRPPMASMDIVTRLENWGACQRGRSGGAMVARESRRSSPYGGQGYKCMTDVICNMLRLAANGPTGGTHTQSKLDFGDADAINRAWQALAVRHKTILKDLYALNRPVAVICRELDIKHWPATFFKRELLDAQNAIYQLTLRNK